MKKTILILLLSIFVISCNNKKVGDDANYPMAWYLDIKEGSLAKFNSSGGSPSSTDIINAGQVYQPLLHQSLDPLKPALHPNTIYRS